MNLKDALGYEVFNNLAFSRNFSQFYFRAVYVTIAGVNLEIYDV